MKFFLPLLIAALSAVAGCQKGACYYSCCNGEEDCAVECEIKTDSAEQCAVFAQDACEQTGFSNVSRVEWKEISDLYCDTCDAIACSPSWWTEDRLIEENPPDTGSDINTHVDGG